MHIINVKTPSRTSMIDITSKIQEIVRKEGKESGYAMCLFHIRRTDHK